MSLVGAEQKPNCSSEPERQEEGRNWVLRVAVGQAVSLEHRA